MPIDKGGYGRFILRLGERDRLQGYITSHVRKEQSGGAITEAEREEASRCHVRLQEVEGELFREGVLNRVGDLTREAEQLGLKRN